MLTCLLLAGRLVLTIPDGAVILPAEVIVTFDGNGLGATTMTVAGLINREVEIPVPIEEVVAVLTACGGA